MTLDDEVKKCGMLTMSKKKYNDTIGTYHATFAKPPGIKRHCEIETPFAVTLGVPPVNKAV